MSNKKSGLIQGFTLIELLVVIAIIGVLSSIVLASLNTAREKARDAKRVADFKTIDLALELYFDKYGRYPTSPAIGGGTESSYNQNFNAVMTILKDEGMIAGVPEDPNGVYMLNDYGSGGPAEGFGYLIVTRLEGIADTTQAPFNSCRVAAPNNWCSTLSASKYFCHCHYY